MTIEIHRDLGPIRLTLLVSTTSVEAHALATDHRAQFEEAYRRALDVMIEELSPVDLLASWATPRGQA